LGFQKSQSKATLYVKQLTLIF